MFVGVRERLVIYPQSDQTPKPPGQVHFVLTQVYSGASQAQTVLSQAYLIPSQVYPGPIQDGINSFFYFYARPLYIPPILFLSCSHNKGNNIPSMEYSIHGIYC